MILSELFKKHRVVGLVGDIGQAKSSLGLNEILDIKENIKDIDVYVMGIEPSLCPYLESKGVKILNSIDDLLDIKIKNSVIFIDEFADLFSTQTNDRQLDRIKKFFNRIEHLNDYVLMSSAQAKFWNSFICGIVRAFLVKSIEYDSLVNGTPLKRKIKGITENTSDYRLDIPKDKFYVITDEDIVRKMSFDYNWELDSKREFINPFKKSEGKYEIKEKRKNLKR